MTTISKSSSVAAARRLHIATRYQTPLAAIGLFVLAFGIRVVNLGQFLTTDEPRGWLGQSMAFMQAILSGNLADTFQHYSPGVTLMWSGSIGLYLNYLFNPTGAATFAQYLQTLPFDPIDPDLIFWFRLPNILIGAICIAIAYPLAQRLLGTRVALLGGLLLTFDPLFIGMNRVLGHDGIAASFMLVSALAAISFFVQRESATYPKLILSAVAAGFAILAKSTALYLLPFIGLTLLITGLYHRQQYPLGRMVRDGLLWGGIVLLTVFIFWPALWTNPIETLQKMLAGLEGAASEPHNRGSFFNGHPIPDPGFSFYWVAAIFRLTAVTTIGLVLGLIALVLKRNKPDTVRSHLTIILSLLVAFVFFYLIFLSFGSKKQDRYIVPILPAVSLLAAFGYVWLAEKLKNRAWQIGVLALMVGLQTAIALSHAPYYLTHYNLLTGGSQTAPQMLLVGWGEGIDLAADYLNQRQDADQLTVASWYHSTFDPYFAGQALEEAGGEKLSRSAKPALAADYAVLYINQIQRQMPTPGLIQYFQTDTPLHIVRVNDIDYAYIYPAPHLQHTFLGEVRLVGQAALLGYSLLDNQGEALEALSTDGAAIMDLYWEWQGKAPEEPISLSLVDEGGQVWGTAEPLGSEARLPFADWREGMIAQDRFALTILPGTPPGEYTLKAWIERPATDEVVGYFPINVADTRLLVTRPTEPPSLTDLSLLAEIAAESIDGIRLLGTTTEADNSPWQADETRQLTLFWQAAQPPQADYPLALNLTDEGGQTRMTWTNSLALGRFATGQWLADDIIRDPWSLTLPAHVPPGNYQLTAQLGAAPPITLQTVTISGRERLFEVPPVDLVVAGQFDQTIELVGVQASISNEQLVASPGQPLALTLIWHNQELIDTDYTVTIQLLDSQNQVRAQRDGVPLEGAALTTSWAAGEVVVDPVQLALPEEIGPGPHRLLVALYQPDSGQRLLMTNGADHLEIPVTVP